jgi:hypothetical protein
VQHDAAVTSARDSGDGTVSTLAALLAPYADPDPTQGPRLIDVPAGVGAQVLAMLPENQVTARLNLVQPPMTWLVAQCADLGGRLVGSVVPGRGFVRFDGVQVGDVSKARTLAERVAADWPATAGVPSALAAATAEAWASWAPEEQPVWTGTGEDLMTAPLPAEAAVLGLWWN